MTGPTGLIFAMRTNYGSERDPNASGYDEAFFNGPTQVSLVVLAPPTILALRVLLTTMLKAPTLLSSTIPPLEPMSRLQMHTGMTTATVEGLDDDTSGSEFREMEALDREGHRHRSCSRPES